MISGVMPGLGSSLPFGNLGNNKTGGSVIGALSGKNAGSTPYGSGSHSGRSGAFTASGYPSGSMADQYLQFRANNGDSTSGKDISYLYGSSDSPGSSGSPSSSGSSGKAKKSEFDWLHADMAKHYGMSKETGYAEAMENTSYQRAVKDMKDAGLNPSVLFGANAADGSGTPGYIRSASSGRSGGSGSGYIGRSSSSGYKWSKSQYGAFTGAGAVIGGLGALIVTKSARGAAAGASAGAAIGAGIAKVLNVF